MATGPAFAGCPTGVCEQTLFGCCDDGETPASALPKAKRRRRRQAEESGDGKRWGDDQWFSQYFQGEAEASGDEAADDDDGASGESEEDGDGSGDAAEEEEEGEDETKCEENKKCQNGKFGKWHVGVLMS